MIVASATSQNCKQMDEMDLNTFYIGFHWFKRGSSNISDIFLMFPLEVILFMPHSTLVDSTLCMWQGIMGVHTSCHEIVPCHPTKE